MPVEAATSHEQTSPDEAETSPVKPEPEGLERLWDQPTGQASAAPGPGQVPLQQIWRDDLEGEDRVRSPASWPGLGPDEPQPGPEPEFEPPGRAHRIAGILLGVALIATGAGSYSVLARDGRPAAKAAPPASPAPVVSPFLAAPRSLAAEAEAFSVSLTWEQPPGGPAVEAFEILRDGRVIASVDPTATGYTDDGVVPGTSYSYGVRATATGIESAVSSVAALTVEPPLSSARVDGVFDVAFKLVSQSGFESYTKSFNRGWRLEATCASGPCKVRWEDVNEGMLAATLTRKGAQYRGSDRGHFNSVCGEAKVTSDLDLDLRVVSAGAVDGEWRATRLEGTVLQTDPPQLGCLGSEAKLSVIVRLAP